MHSHPPSNNKEVAGKLKVEMYESEEVFSNARQLHDENRIHLDQQNVIKITTEWNGANVHAVLSTPKPSFVVVNKIPQRGAEYCVFMQ